jgi:anti-sigma B factor antagonist
MAVNVRVDDRVVVLSNFGRLMDDPRHFDTTRVVKDLLEQGHRDFVLELRGIGDLGPSGLGLLVTITRLVRRHDGDVVLAHPSRSMEKLIDEMQMDAYWEVFPSVAEAEESFDHESP